MSEPTSNRPASCPSDLVFDEWLAAELPPERAGEIDAHVRDCAPCRDRRAVREREQATFLAAAPTFADHAALVGRPAPTAGASRRPRRAAWRWSGAAAAVAAVAVAAILVLRPAPDDSGERIKGAPHLTMFVQHGGQARRGESGERVQPGDKLQFAYSMGDARHLAIVGRDARGAAARYFPLTGATAALPAGARVSLDFAVQLDDVLGREVMYGLFCPAAIDVDAVVSALGKTGRLLDLPRCTVDRIVLEKEAAR
jgi:hypothetical protein